MRCSAKQEQMLIFLRLVVGASADRVDGQQLGFLQDQGSRKSRNIMFQYYHAAGPCGHLTFDRSVSNSIVFPSWK
jgi:hypothetical protein